MYGSISVRWVVYTLKCLTDLTNSSLGVVPSITLHIVAINPAAIVATTN